MDVGRNWAGSEYPGVPKDSTIVNPIMLRFRPIAPKPVANSSARGSMIETHKMEMVSKPRTKRKYVRVKKNSNCRNKEEKKDGPFGLDDHGGIVTLQLLPESSGGAKSSPGNDRSYQKSTSISYKSEYSDVLTIATSNLSDRTVQMRSGRMIESWVMVDGVTKTCVDGGVLGRTDVEKMKNLEVDTCPGFISDDLGSVKWVNQAYRKMIDPMEGEGDAPAEMVVWLVMKEKETVALSPAFACTVRVVYTWQKMKQSRTMPCDVWKMDFGRFAWRFDAKAALCLGR